MRKILIIDDEEDFYTLLADSFASKDFIIEVASSGKEAIEKLQNQKIDAIISDINMPGLSGIQLFKQIKDLGLLVSPFVFLTGFNQADYNFLLDYGVDRIFEKPSRMDEIVEYVDGYFENLTI